MATQQIRRRRAYWNREIKHAQNPPPLSLTKSSRNRNECRFPDSHERMANQQFRIVVGKCGEQREAAPKDCAQNNNQFSRVAISERSHKRRGDHIETKE